ncbi:MAG: GntR family transcriptional regulator [Candidatus Heteroscillospira sp.]
MAKAKSLADQVYDHIIEKIKLGELAEGEKLDETVLIKEIGTSRTPIREALLMLSADRVLEFIPRKGFFVRRHDIKELRQAYSVLACLETFAVRMVIDRLNDYDYAKMSNLIDLMDIAINLKEYARYVENQESFHNYCVEKTENPVLIDAIASIKKQYPRQTHFGTNKNQQYEMLKNSNSGHRNILVAIQEKNVPLLEKLLSSHWVWDDKTD